MNKLTLQEILKIVVDECRNGCTDARSAYMYFCERYKDRIVDEYQLGLFLETLNFYAIREKSTELHGLFG